MPLEVWPDTSNTDPSYWTKILKKLGLTENRGRRWWLSYGHDYQLADSGFRQKQQCGGGRRIPPHKTLGQIEKDGFSR